VKVGEEAEGNSYNAGRSKGKTPAILREEELDRGAENLIEKGKSAWGEHSRRGHMDGR
jgi:hypothetical protein